jgi:serine-type D-Ala-D-Ala carboxypeptidase (penicillin-binding protein 5/6)
MPRASIALLAAVATLAAPAWGSAQVSSPSAPPPHIASAAWYAVGEDGAVVAAHDARSRRAMASITKLMTAIVTLEHTRLSDVVTVDPRAARIGESTVYLRSGQQLTVEQLLQGALVKSANDAAEALALYVGRGSESRFVAMMNAEARQLGLSDTHYVNPHGLDAAGHYSSARDTTALLRYAFGIAFLRKTLGRTEVEVPEDGRFQTTDDLLESWPPLVAGKTGHTADAGWSETAAAREHGITVFGSVLGSRNEATRNDALRALLQYALDRYRRVLAIDPKRVYAEAATGYGRPKVELVAARRAVRTIPERTSLVVRVVAPATVKLPVHARQRLGTVTVSAHGRVVASAALVARAAVSKPGLGGRLAWYAKRTAHHLWGLVT